MKATVVIETVSPTEAAAMLGNMYDKQRPLRETWVRSLAGEMKSGKFMLSCDAIVLHDGMVLNGQHRLNAVVESNTSCQFLILRTDDPEIFKIIDTGIKRQVGDVLYGFINRSEVASAARWILGYERQTITATSQYSASAKGDKQLLRSEHVAFIERNAKKLQDAATVAKAYYHKNRFLGPSIAAALIFLANRERKDDSGSRFIRAVYEGASDDASRDVRTKLINNSISRAKLPATYVFAILIKAFKSWENGTRPSNLKYAIGEQFPNIGKKQDVNTEDTVNETKIRKTGATARTVT